MSELQIKKYILHEIFVLTLSTYDLVTFSWMGKAMQMVFNLVIHLNFIATLRVVIYFIKVSLQFNIHTLH